MTNLYIISIKNPYKNILTITYQSNKFMPGSKTSKKSKKVFVYEKSTSLIQNLETENPHESKMLNKLQNIKWKQIEGLNNYMISTNGQIMNVNSGQILKQHILAGYYVISLRKNKYKIHRLVAITFIKNPNKFPVVDHIDNDKLNNDVKNLRWVTLSTNSKSYHDNHKPKRGILQYNIRGKLIKKWQCINDILKKYKNYTRTNINTNLRNASKTAYGFIWRYKNNNKKSKIELKNDEIFKKIGLFENSDLSDYNVSNYGNIKNKRGMIMQSRINHSGYKTIHLKNIKTSKRQQYEINRLVAYIFISSHIKNKYLQVNHIDKNRTNNHYKNLEWITARENIIHAQGKKVYMIDSKTDKILRVFGCATDAGLFFGNKNGFKNISNVCTRRRKTAFGYKWEYVDADICPITLVDLRMADSDDIFD